MCAMVEINHKVFFLFFPLLDLQVREKREQYGEDEGKHM